MRRPTLFYGTAPSDFHVQHAVAMAPQVPVLCPGERRNAVALREGATARRH